MLPCGHCVGCHLDRSQSWALRARHESSCWDNNAFLTLTYDDDHLPWHGSLSRSAPRDFIRRLRRAMRGVQCAPGSERRPIRYFGCGEYGSQRARAHYHILLFNVRFEDQTKYGQDTFTSELVSHLWPAGTHLIGSLTPASAAYTAGYALKKVSKWAREEHYTVLDYETGELHQRVPEFSFMSLKPPIGYYWYAKNKSDLRHGFCLADGAQVAIPRLYKDKLELDDPVLFDEMQFNRFNKLSSYDPADRSEARLAARKAVMLSRRSTFSKSHLED